jgi:predicted nucleic acid-binding Zn ribbon protein
MTQQRPNRKSFVPLGTVIETILLTHRHSSDKALLEVWGVWEAAVGNAIAANARPAAFKGDLLLVHVRSSTWLHHLHFLEKEMISKLNEALGGHRVREIKLKVGSF